MMRALCTRCGFHHEVVRVFSENSSEDRGDVYQIASLGECESAYLSERDLFESSARFGLEAVLDDDDG